MFLNETIIFIRCSYIAITDIIFPGLFLSYCNRYDKSKGLKMYTFSGCTGYFIGILIYLASYKLVS